jgi:hypothetical protein
MSWTTGPGLGTNQESIPWVPGSVSPGVVKLNTQVGLEVKYSVRIWTGTLAILMDILVDFLRPSR